MAAVNQEMASAREEVVQRVQVVLKKHQPAGMEINVVAEAVRQENGWWYVPVRPSAELLATYQYYEVLAEVEGELEETSELNVLLVPTAPE
jgi:hypothetical protein